eukprot:1435219-Pleurochrysis_carterae.AAC.1
MSPPPASPMVPTTSRPRRKRGCRGGRRCQRARASAVTYIDMSPHCRPPPARTVVSTQTTSIQPSASTATHPSLPHVRPEPATSSPPLPSRPRGRHGDRHRQR